LAPPSQFSCPSKPEGQLASDGRLRIGVFDGFCFGDHSGKMKLILHTRPSGLRDSRWAQKSEEYERD